MAGAAERPVFQTNCPLRSIVVTGKWFDIFGETPVLEPDRGGLRCSAGDFWIDPIEPVPTAFVTHAHSDHLRPGHDDYVVSQPTVPLARRRLSQADPDSFELSGVPYGEPVDRQGVRVSFHPAGHMLGSAQIRVEVDDRVWVVTGDYKRAADPTCRAFEPVECDVFITETTFGLPIYRWPDPDTVVADIYEWWMKGRGDQRPSVLFCYAVGKAQRILAHLDELTSDTVYLHGAMVDFVKHYRAAGIEMPPTEYVTDFDEETDFSGELILAPTSAHDSSWMRRFDAARTGFASGWMRVRAPKRRRGYDAGFVLSDHCDWSGLIDSVRDSTADTIIADHGDTDAFVRYLREEMDRRAFSMEQLAGGSTDEEIDERTEGAVGSGGGDG